MEDNMDADGPPDLAAWLAGFTEEEHTQAALQIENRRRWHARNGADWLAIRLQCGRGRLVREVADEFGVPPSSIRDRMQSDRWMRTLSPADRQELSRQVMLGGYLMALARREAPDWRRLAQSAACGAAPPALLWRPRERGDPDIEQKLRDHGETDAACTAAGNLRGLAAELLEQVLRSVPAASAEAGVGRAAAGGAEDGG
jgi:hypothetical protein